MPVRIAACFLATVCFSFLMNQPLRTVLPSAFIAAGGYLVFLLLGETTAAYFVSAFLIAVACEMLARKMKTGATLFITSAIIPLVPGLGLYRTMFYLSQDYITTAGEIGSDTILGISAIALAITFSSILFNRSGRSASR